MFGYLRVEESELLVKEYEQYKAIYCSLCKQLGKDYSILTRFILSYDSTFYSIFLMRNKTTCPGFKEGRCTFNPLKKCYFCINSEDALEKAAAISVITAYYKLIDDIKDSGFFKRLYSRFLLLFFKRWKKKAEKKYPYLNEIVEEMLNSQFIVEKDENCNIDMAAEPTAIMMSKILVYDAKNKEEKIILKQLGYHLGRWIYFIDAVDDIEEDIKENNFNPFIKKYNEDKEDKKEFKKYCKATLNQCLYHIYNAYNLLEINSFNGIINNIFLLGLGSEQVKVLHEGKRKVKNEKSI